MEPDADEAAEIEELEKDLDALHANMEDKRSRDYDVTERQWNQINSHSGHSHVRTAPFDNFGSTIVCSCSFDAILGKGTDFWWRREKHGPKRCFD